MVKIIFQYKLSNLIFIPIFPTLKAPEMKTFLLTIHKHKSPPESPAMKQFHTELKTKVSTFFYFAVQ